MSKKFWIITCFFTLSGSLFAGGVLQKTQSAGEPSPCAPSLETPSPEKVIGLEPTRKISGCDTLWYRNGTHEVVNLIKVGQNSVTYTPCGGGTQSNLPVDRIQAIHYSSGKVQEFGNENGNGLQGSEGGTTGLSSEDLLRRKADRKSWAAFGFGFGCLFVPFIGIFGAFFAIGFWLGARPYYKAKGRTNAASFGVAGFFMGLAGLLVGIVLLIFLFSYSPH